MSVAHIILPYIFFLKLLCSLIKTQWEKEYCTHRPPLSVPIPFYILSSFFSSFPSSFPPSLFGEVDRIAKRARLTERGW